MTQYRVFQKQAKKELKLAKLNYKDKVEKMLSTSNSHPAWEGVKAMMGMQSKKCPISLNGMSDLAISNELNTFYNRFNTYDFSEELSVFNSIAPGQSNVQVDRNKVLTLFRGLKERKSPGPDGIGGHILKNCAEQLADIFCFIFKMSLHLHTVPNLWKDSIIVPVPKNKTPESFNDFRPVAVSSLVMKTLEKIVKDEVLNSEQDLLDRFNSPTDQNGEWKMQHLLF